MRKRVNGRNKVTKFHNSQVFKSTPGYTHPLTKFQVAKSNSVGWVSFFFEHTKSPCWGSTQRSVCLRLLQRSVSHLNNTVLSRCLNGNTTTDSRTVFSSTFVHLTSHHLLQGHPTRLEKPLVMKLLACVNTNYIK